MPFRFPLQAVLHFRQSMEHQQELRLRAANQQVARVQHLIELADARMLNLQSTQRHELGAGTTAAELQFGLLCLRELLQQRHELEPHLAQVQQLREQQREIFRRTRQERETLESVRDRQLDLYRKEAARREQRSLDDLFLLRREYTRRG
jgi:flagellar export protein FliJ